MNNQSFDTKRIAEGYAKDRPYLHPQVMDTIRKDLSLTESFQHGLDLGCGSGLSTKALKALCEKVTGTDIRKCEKVVHRHSRSRLRRAEKNAWLYRLHLVPEKRKHTEEIEIFYSQRS